MDRQQIFQYTKQQYGTEAEYPWMDRNAVLRHSDNKKWYALIMEVGRDKLGLPGDTSVDILNIKCEPLLIGSLRMRPGFFPAYHMNKDRWISILLDDTIPEEELKSLIALSYTLTAPKQPVKKTPNEKVYQMRFAKIYPLLVAKAERKGRTKAEVDEIICWLTGNTQEQLERETTSKITYGEFFEAAPMMNPNRKLITGVVCGVRVENIKEPLMQDIRYLDKMVDELAKGKPMEKILRKP